MVWSLLAINIFSPPSQNCAYVTGGGGGGRFEALRLSYQLYSPASNFNVSIPVFASNS